MRTQHLLAALVTLLVIGCDDDVPVDPAVATAPDGLRGGERALRDEGREVFRYDTFNDEALWTDVLGMHTIIATSISPRTALAVGLKVDAEVLPEGILGQVDLDDPATTVALLSLDAVVGVEGHVVDGELQSVGVTCALCHSTVDDSLAPGIGSRLDGHPNRDLDPGLILSLSDAFTDDQKADLRSWGPGYYDPRWNQDGISAPVLIPPAYGLKHVPVETYTGDGPVSYWNSYVAVTQMGGQGVFIDPRIGVEVVRTPDLVTPQLPALLAYQLSLKPPVAPAGSFDAAAAERGAAVFTGRGRCSSCHERSAFTDAGTTLHSPDEVGQDPLHASRSATGAYRTTPLRGAWDHPPYFHDGSAATLDDVVDHYDAHLELGLTDGEHDDLVQYLLSL